VISGFIDGIHSGKLHTCISLYVHLYIHIHKCTYVNMNVHTNMFIRNQIVIT
jgi:hypothetical protein